MTHLLTATLLLAIAAGQPAADPAAELHELFADYDRWQQEEFPLRAMRRGNYENADRLADWSLAAIDRRHRRHNQVLLTLRLLDRDALGEQDRVSYDLFEDLLTQRVDEHAFREFLAPVAARRGPQQDIPEMGQHVRFESVEDYVNYVSRLEKTPQLIEQTIDLMRLGAHERRVPPRIVVRAVPGQIRSLLEPGGLDSLETPLERMPPVISPEEAGVLTERFQQRTMPAVRDALAAMLEFLEEEYLPACRESIAAVDWPDGEAYYAFQLRKMTTTDLGAAEIHQIGLDEVARIRAEMMTVIRSSDFMERRPEASALDDETLFAAFLEYLRTDPRFYHETAEDLIAGYRAICKEIDGHMPRFFGTLPRLPYGVREIPAFMAPQQTTAYYMRGDLRNHEAGFFYANTYRLDQRPTYEMIPLALHEAVPGHHHQIALALELEGLPEFRKEGWYTAYGEGWALYTERLGIEMGLYEDPYDDFGRLLYEMWRACRLVVDPGMHALGWSRQQAIDYMLANTALSELNIVNEVDRYIAWPGQATAYKLGELKIRSLRQRAEQRLGERFSLRDFHDVVLSAGSIPLHLLEQRVDAWINEVRMGGAIYD